jgi:hypothetical protein
MNMERKPNFIFSSIIRGWGCTKDFGGAIILARKKADFVVGEVSEMRQPSNRKDAHKIGGGQYQARFFFSLL